MWRPSAPDTLRERMTAVAAGRVQVDIPNDVSPPYHFSPVTPGMSVDKTPRPFVVSDSAASSRLGGPIQRPADLEDVAFWPATHLADLLRSRQVKFFLGLPSNFPLPFLGLSTAFPCSNPAFPLPFLDLALSFNCLQASQLN